MTYSQLIQTYMGVGLLAARPTSPNVGAGVGAFYWATDNNTLYFWDGSVWHALAGGSGSLSYVMVCEQQTSGTQGGTFTSGAWQTRTLNTKQADTASIASLASNQVTLPAGTYICRAAAPAFGVWEHMARLYNVTDSSVVLTGASQEMEAATTTNCSAISGAFVLGSSKALRVEHKTSTTQATNGFGAAAGLSTETYTVAEFWKIA